MNHFRNVFLSGVLVAVSLIGCGSPTESGTSNLGQQTTTDAGTTQVTDAGTKTDAGTVAPSDAGTSVDAGAPVDAGQTIDAGTGTNCKEIANFTPVNVMAGYDETYEVAYSALEDSATEPKNLLYMEAYDLTSFPQTEVFDSSTNYQTCMTCVIYMENCSADICEKYYLAQSGEATLQSVTPAVTGGAMDATAQDLKLLEWDFENDVPMANGACVKVGTADFSATW